MKAFVILNPAAGKKTHESVREALGRHFGASHIQYEVHETRKTDKPGDIVRTRLREGFNLAVAAGGDGTVSDVIDGLVENPKPLGIVPTGTGNLIARELGIPDNVNDAVAVIASAPRSTSSFCRGRSRARARGARDRPRARPGPRIPHGPVSVPPRADGPARIEEAGRCVSISEFPLALPDEQARVWPILLIDPSVRIANREIVLCGAGGTPLRIPHLLGWRIGLDGGIHPEDPGQLAPTRRVDFRYLTSLGGMPSAHSAMVSAVATSVGLIEGFGSTIFIVTLVFALLVMFDASTVRRAAGLQARLLNQVVEVMLKEHHLPTQKLREILGHTRMEVFAGMLVGIAIGMAMHLLMN